MRISDILSGISGNGFCYCGGRGYRGGVINAVAALACISWPKFARIARSQVMTLKEAPFIAAAWLSGCKTWKIIGKHMLPNIAGPILITGVLDIGTMMMEIAGLSFLGLGAVPPIAEWGSMMSSGRSMLQTSPWGDPCPGFCNIFHSYVI